MAPIADKTELLGDEYDDDLRSALLTVLKELGAVITDKSWGVAGSQELETLDVQIAGKLIVVEAETYIGLSITGESTLVDQIAEMVRRRLEAGA